MSQITINNQTYLIDELSDEAKQQLTNLQVVDQEIAQLNRQLIIYQTARAAYANALAAAVSAHTTKKSRTRKSKTTS